MIITTCKQRDTYRFFRLLKSFRMEVFRGTVGLIQFVVLVKQQLDRS